MSAAPPSIPQTADECEQRWRAAYQRTDRDGQYLRDLDAAEGDTCFFTAMGGLAAGRTNGSPTA